MKKRLSFALSVLLLVCVALSLSACSEKEGNDAVKGTWKATSVEYAGFSMTTAEAEMGDIILEFNGAGKVKLSYDGNEGKTSYTLQDNVVTFEADDLALTGKLADNKLTFEDWAGMGLTIVFEKAQ